MTDHVKGYVAGEEGVGPVLQERGTDPDALRRICRRQERQVRACRQRPGLGPHGNIDWASPKATVTLSAAWPSSSMSGTTVTRCPTGRLSAGRDGTGRRRAFRRQRTSGRIMKEALSLAPAGSLTPLTFHYVIGLMGMHRPEALGSDRAAAGGRGTGRASGQEFQERQGPSRAPARDRPPGPRTLSRGAQAAGRTLRTPVRSRNRPAGATDISDPNLHPARAQGGSSRRARRARPQAARPSPRIRRRRTGRQPLPQPEGRRPAHARAVDHPRTHRRQAHLLVPRGDARPHAPSIGSGRETSHGQRERIRHDPTRISIGRVPARASPP